MSTKTEISLQNFYVYNSSYGQKEGEVIINKFIFLFKFHSIDLFMNFRSTKIYCIISHLKPIVILK